VKKVLFVLFVLFSVGTYAQKKSVYIHAYIVNGISLSTGDKKYNSYAKSSYAPSLGILVEKKLNTKLSIQSGFVIVDRASTKHVFEDAATAVEVSPYLDRWQVTHEHIYYLTIPVYLKKTWNNFYVSAGLDHGFPLYSYQKQTQPETRVYKGSAGDKTPTYSLVIKAGYDFQLKNSNSVCIDFQANQQIARLDGSKLFNDSRLNLGIGLGYKILLPR